MAETSTSSSDQSESQESRDKQSEVPISDGLQSQKGDKPVIPVMYPVFVPGLLPPHQHQELLNRGPGLYAVPVLPYMQPMAGFPSHNLIPFTYNLPTERSAPEAREVGGEQGQPGEQPLQHQQAGPQREVARRFQIALQFDLLLILKLAAVIFLFNQDGSRQRLTLLVFFASVVYLYQTGALAPVIRWLSQGMRRAAAPPARPVRPDNLPAAAAGELGNENAGLAEGEAIGDNEIENEDGGGGRLWVIVKEIQMIVFGFITSLLPGFQNID